MQFLFGRLRHLSPRNVGLASAIITVLVWTSFIVVARASASGHLLAYDIAWARIVGAGSILMPWGAWLVWRARQRGEHIGSFFGISPLPWRLTVLIGLFGGLGYAVLAYSGFFYAPAAHASVLMPGSLPLWTSLLAVWLLGERLHRLRIIGLLLIVGGDVLVGGSSLLKAFDGGDVWRGDVLFMCAAFCWSCYSVLTRRHGLQAVQATIAITTLAFFVFVPGYPLLCAMGVLSSHLLTAPLGEVVFQAVYQGVGSVVISGITFTYMIRHYGPVRSTMITALVPGLSALGAVVFLDEPLHWNLIAGLLLVTGGILFGVRAATAAPAPTPAAEPRA